MSGSNQMQSACFLFSDKSFLIKVMILIVRKCYFSHDMENIFKLIGAGPFTTEMVMQSKMVMSLQEDIDFGWWVRYEYRFKGKDHLGFRRAFHKMTSTVTSVFKCILDV